MWHMCDADTLKVKGEKKMCSAKANQKEICYNTSKNSETTGFMRKCLSKKLHDDIRLNWPWREQGHSWIQLIKTSKRMQKIIELWREMGTL